VREGLGEVAELTLLYGVVLLRQQANVIAKSKQALEKLDSLCAATLQEQVVGEPEATRQEGAFTCGQAVDARISVVAAHQPVDSELALDSGNGTSHARVVGRQEAD
jgi:hypothetical protein